MLSIFLLVCCLSLSKGDRMFLLLLVIEAERLVGAGKWAVGNQNRQNCQGALDSYLESGLRSPGWVGGVARTLVCHKDKVWHNQQQPRAWNCAVQPCMQSKQVCRTVELWLSTVTPDDSFESLFLCHTGRSYLRPLLLIAMTEAQRSVRCKSVITLCTLH